MRFLTDQDVYRVTVQFLQRLGHDVVTAAELGLSRAIDADLLRQAHADHRIFVTRDRDYGNLVFVKTFAAGVVFLRVLPKNVSLVHSELISVLSRYSETELLQSFLVVEPGRHRIRRLP